MKATAAPPRPAGVRATPPRRRTRLRALSGSGNATALIGGSIVAVTIIVAVFAPLIAPDDPLATNPSSIGLGPFSGGHLLGTDEVGRDILSRLMYGTRLALLVAVVPTLVALVIGGCLGLLSGYVGGWLDSTLMRVFDVMFSFPGILLALGIGVALGPGITSMVIAMVVVTVPEFGRIVRGNVIALRQEQYVEAAGALGYSHLRIALRHITPNLLGGVVVFATLQTGRNVILSSSLAFLGLGAQPPTPDWGQMLSGGRALLVTAPHVATIPGLAIVVLAVGFNLLGDGIRDRLDPRSRRSRAVRGGGRTLRTRRSRS
ncbi:MULTISPECIES: ABC transporter permease [Streptomyces]|uniref:ABC transporter permease n=1 Tax=Streptomyces TaxID=1883 RepID=UPI0001C19B09|nr:ABC transporter permease [Streptomyces sp. ACT-1]EGE39852.1 ABC-type transporter, integral membrane subunit [Streptomyces sp. ACT-1]MYR12811.1 ABC transporter permease subunit [Streptomyces sp. SID724]MYR47936.1 ABC transporter permease subunit [Streptomyces sp. SID4928]NEB52006.1 ABC transporter permease [Streptomyces griseus]